MSAPIARPKRGLPPDAALAWWSDTAAYAALVSLAGTPDLPVLEIAGNVIRDAEHHKEYRKKRWDLEVAFRKLLADGTILASAIPAFADSREVIQPSLWDVIFVNFQFGEVMGQGRRYYKPEFFEHAAIPLNVRAIPDWLDAELGALGLNVFRYDRDYRHVVLNGIPFTLSPIHAKVIALLHQGWLNGEPWQKGAEILDQAGSAQIKMVDVFKSRPDWKSLIDSDGKGMYRLRLAPREPAISG